MPKLIYYQNVKDLKELKVTHGNLYINFKNKFISLDIETLSRKFEFDFGFWAFLEYRDFLVCQKNSREEVYLYNLKGELVDTNNKYSLIISKNAKIENGYLVFGYDRNTKKNNWFWFEMTAPPLRISRKDNLKIGIISKIKNNTAFFFSNQFSSANNLTNGEWVWKSIDDNPQKTNINYLDEELVSTIRSNQAILISIATGVVVWKSKQYLAFSEEKDYCLHSLNLLKEDDKYYIEIIKIDFATRSEISLAKIEINKPQQPSISILFSYRLIIEESKIILVMPFIKEIIIIDYITLETLNRFTIKLPKRALIGTVKISGDKLIVLTGEEKKGHGSNLSIYHLEKK